MHMQNALQQLRHLQKGFKKELENLPKGSLCAKTHKESTYYYHTVWNSKKKSYTYLNPRSLFGATMIQKLFRQRFLRHSLPVLEKNISALSHALKNFQPYDPNEIIEKLPVAYQGIPKGSGIWTSQESDLKTWANDSYPKNTSYSNELIHETLCGIFVRSKSEAMIADLLTHFQIFFRYEPLITANQKTYSPDFIILLPRDHETMYWEHLGQMDNPDYVVKNASKLMDYQKAGININQNLIITMETKSQPLTSKEILNTITARLF